MPRKLIGPRRPSGAFYKKRPAVRKPRARARANAQLATVGQVKKLIHKNVESKLVGVQASVYRNQSITTAVADCLQLLPSIPLGTTDNTRLGNKITAKGLLVNLTLFLSRDIDPEDYPQGCTILPRAMVLQQKDTRKMTDLTAAGFDATHLLDHGTGEHQFDGYLIDYSSPINKDGFIVHKDIRTKLSTGTQEYNGMITRTFKIWVKCPKVLNFLDNETYPTNFAPFLAVGFANPDNILKEGSVLGVAYTSTLYYEDA